jgi:hypothetical protein
MGEFCLENLHLRLYQLIKGKTAAPSEASVEPPKE